MSADRSALVEKMQTYLLRREYSAHELRLKLCAVFAKEEVNALLQEFQQAGWQSDRRFCDMLIRTRAAQGYGRHYVVQELKQHQISDELIDQALAESEVDWQSVLKKAYEKRCLSQLPKTPRDKIKCQQYLWRRGFTQDELKALFTE